MSDDCLFCRILAGGIASKKVYEDEHTLAFEDINPQAPTHILLIPKEHVASLEDVTDEHGAMLSDIAQAAAHLARTEGIDQTGWRLVTNVGPDAGQSVFHLHFHLLGGRPMGWPPG